MAEFDKIQVGDTLRVDLEVYGIGATSVLARMLPDHDGGRPSVHVSGENLHAAEHIPAPKTFKRGDWVRSSARRTLRYGIVTGVDRADIAVAWPNSSDGEWLPHEDIDPDEAPE